MAVAPKFAAHAWGAPTQVHTLEFYLDYTCPFSAKLFHTLYSQIIPLITSLYPNRIHLIFRHQIQPWHPSSTLVHEAALAVERLTKEKAPQKFWDYSRALFEHQKEYFDLNVVGETRNQTYERLARLAEETVGVGREDVMELLRIERKEGDEEGALNIGNQVTNDLKLHIKAARLTGIHVSPTVVFNGNVENSISSGWSKEQWEEWLEKNVV